MGGHRLWTAASRSWDFSNARSQLESRRALKRGVGVVPPKEVELGNGPNCAAAAAQGICRLAVPDASLATVHAHIRHYPPPPPSIPGSVFRASSTMAAMSPSSSPRLPSPPPIAEDQLGPKSPIAEEHSEEAKVDQGSARRIRSGTKAQDMADGPPLADLKDVRSRAQWLLPPQQAI